MTVVHDHLRYRARCSECPWASQQFARHRMADSMAREHARANEHITYIADQNDVRVAGSTIHWSEA